MAKAKTKWYQTTPGIILLIVLFFPLGLLLMWGSTWNKKVKIGVTILVIIVGIFALNSKDKTSTIVNQTTVATPTTKAPQTFEEKVKAQLGEQESMTIENATNIDTNDPIPDGKQINITMNLGKDQWDLNAAKERVWARTARLTQSLFPLDNNVYALQITANVPTTDAYGKSQQTELALIIITRATFNKIGWDNFDYHNIPTIADSYYEDHSIK